MKADNDEWSDLDDFVRSHLSRWERFKVWLGYRKARRGYVRRG